MENAVKSNKETHFYEVTRPIGGLKLVKFDKETAEE